MMIAFGSTATDKITGFTGVVTGYTQYITGCNQVLLSPKAAPDGALRDGAWFDEQRLDVVPGPLIRLENGSTPGFDKPAPKK